MANFKNSNDVYNKIISVDKLVDIDEIFFNGDEFDFVTKVTYYDPLAKKYTVATDELGETLERPFDVSLALEDLILSQYLPEFTDYFADINRYSTLTTEELSQLKDMLTKRSSFSYQFKGTKTAIEFVLSIFSNALGHYLLSADPDPYRNFVYRISTDLPREFWMKDVKPIVHPNGWGDNYILIIPEFPDYVQLKSEHEIREIIKHTPAAFSYLDLNYWYDLLKPKRTFTYVESALASVGDLHEHFKYSFHHYQYDSAQAFTDGIRQELMLPGYFETCAVRTSSAREYRMEYHRAGVALEYHWTIFRNGVIVRMEKTYQPTLDFTPVDDVTHEAMLTLKRGSWEHTVGPFKLYTIHRPGVFPAPSAAPQITDESILDITAEDKLHRYELLDATRGDHHLNLFRDAKYGATMTDWLALEAMTVSYDEAQAISTNYQTNRVFYTGPEMIDRYVWTVEKNGNPLVVRETIVPELVIDTAAWETEPELSPGVWLHAGVKSGWQVTLTVYQAGFSREVGTVTFGSMPDVVPPASFSFSGKPTALTNSTTATFTPGENADTFEYKWKLDNGVWSAPIERVGGAFPVLTFAGLSEGSHTLYYQAADVSGNWSETWSYTWTIDITAPVVTLVTDFGDYANHTNATINVNGSADAVDYDYRVDGGAWSARRSFALDIIINSITEGSHTVDVRGYDAAGNTATVSKTWTVDRTAPVVDVTSGFPAVSPTNQQDYTFTVGGGGATQYQYKFDTNAWSGWISVATPIVLTNLYDGTHTLLLKGKDAAGNEQGTATTRTWVMESSRLEFTLPLALGAHYANPVFTGDNVLYDGQTSGWTSSGIHYFSQTSPSSPSIYIQYGPSNYTAYPFGVIFNESENVIYFSGWATNYFGTVFQANLVKIDATTKNVISSISSLPFTKTVNTQPSGKQIFEVGNYLYVQVQYDQVVKVDKSTFSVAGTITLQNVLPKNRASEYSWSCNVGNVLYLTTNTSPYMIYKYDMDTGALLGSAGLVNANTDLYYDEVNDFLVCGSGIINKDTLAYTKVIRSGKLLFIYGDYYFRTELSYTSSPLVIKKQRLDNDQVVQSITVNVSNSVGQGIYDPIANRWWVSNGKNILVINP